MGEMTDYSDGGSSSGQEVKTATVPKVEVFGLELPSETTCTRHIGDNIASSSGSNLRSSFIGMGFSPSLVDRVIKEKGEDDADLLLESLFAYSALQNSNSESSDSMGGLFDDRKDESIRPEFTADSRPKVALHKSNSESSDSLDSLFDDNKDAGRHPEVSTHIHSKEEPDVSNGADDVKRATILSMNFSVNEVNFAMDKLGEDAPVNDLVDFIIAAQMAENPEQDTEDATHGNEKTNEDSNTETLYGTMDKTLRLLEMGFSENEISSAIDKFGSEVPISELADSIFAGKFADASVEKDKYSSTASNMKGLHTGNDYKSLCRGMVDGLKRHSSDTFTVKEEYDPFTVKEEEYSLDAGSEFRDIDFNGDRRGKRPKQEYFNDSIDDSSTSIGPAWLQSRKCDSIFTSRRKPLPHRLLYQGAERMDRFGMHKLSKSSPCKSIDKMVAKPPYFFYGNVVNVSQDSWGKISQFLYAIEPEFVNTQFFSALSRKEGYVHNLPSEDRFHILPKPPMTIEDAIAHTKKWWPSWDTRKQLSCISTETSGISQLCDRLGKILIGSHGLLSVEQQRDILHHCRTLNLVWVGQYQLGPVEPEHLERILGYPQHHTQAAESSLIERLQSLKHCFQTDTLGYHLSVLKSLFPEGLTVLSIYSGIGGAEVTLHRLGIRLKGVVSVETSETKRKILMRWWRNTGQTGELVQLEDIQRLTSNKLESLINKFGGFDFIICQNPSTAAPRSSKIAADSDTLAGFDFSLYYEFVRVLQRVRSTMERKK